ncbi:MAG: DUF177 domain-containing protein [Bacteroidota bacterium]
MAKKVLDKYVIDIYGLSDKVHDYSFEIDDKFFAVFDASLVEKGNLKVDVQLNKTVSFIEASFKIEGIVELTCDRSLDEFDYEISSENAVIFKFSDEEAEIDDKVVLILRDAQRLELSQFIYEFIGLAIPMRKLHPRFQEEDEDDSEELFYTSSEEEKEETSEIDPRWEALKKIKGT